MHRHERRIVAIDSPWFQAFLFVCNGLQWFVLASHGGTRLDVAARLALAHDRKVLPADDVARVECSLPLAPWRAARASPGPWRMTSATKEGLHDLSMKPVRHGLPSTFTAVQARFDARSVPRESRLPCARTPLDTVLRALCKAFEVRLGKPPAAVALDIVAPVDVHGDARATMAPIETSCFPAATLCVWRDVPTFDASKMTSTSLSGARARSVRRGPCR